MNKLFYWINVFLSACVSILRFGAGASGKETASGSSTHYLYEFEGCPFCRIAREAISESGQSVIVRPCPKGGKRFRPLVREIGGKEQFPLLVSRFSEDYLYESSDIARKFAEDSETSRPVLHALGPLNLVTSQLGVLLRLFSGIMVKKAAQNDVPLVFYGAERNPTARLVKELLCELELEYEWHPHASGGTVKLIEPQTSTTVSGARSICDYLKQEYYRR